MHPDVVALTGFVAVLGGVSLLALVAGRVRPRDRPATARGTRPDPTRPGPTRPGPARPPLGRELEEWALAGRGNGTLTTWVLLGGSMFTAYTFIAVPALVYGVGALGFFAVPYTIIVFQLGFVLLPRLQTAARRHGWVTPADAVRDRFSSSSLALAVALTGILATMPYVALQLLGISALLTVLGVPPHGPVTDVALTATFTVLAVSTYRHGLRAPTVVAAVKAVLVFATTAALVWAGLHAVGGPGAVVRVADPVLRARPDASLLLPQGLASSYITLAVGSALALVLYPHVLLPAFAARDGDVLRRVSVWMPAWTALLAVVAFAGLAAVAGGITVPAGRAELALPTLLHARLPALLAGLVLGVVAIAALVPAAVMSVAAASTFASNVYLEYVNPAALPSQVTQVARVVSVLVKLGALVFVVGLRGRDAITLQLLGGVWILQTLPALVLGWRTRRLHRYGLLVGLVVGLALGTWLVAAQGFVAVTRIPLPAAGGIYVYAGLVALAVNVAVAALLGPLLDRVGVTRGLGDVEFGGGAGGAGFGAGPGRAGSEGVAGAGWGAGA